MTLTASTVDLMNICETGEICNEEEIKEQLNVRGLLVVLELGIIEECRIVSIDIRLIILSRMLFPRSLRDINIRLLGFLPSCLPGDSGETGFGGLWFLRSS